MLADLFVVLLALLAFVIISLVMIDKKEAVDDAYERGWLDGYKACEDDQYLTAKADCASSVKRVA